jgi:hypothetical protein
LDERTDVSNSDLYGDSVYESGDAVDDSDINDPIDDLAGDDPDENEETGYSPPDREPYNLRHVPTGAEEARGETLAEHLAEEEPDVWVNDVDDLLAEPRAGRLLFAEGGDEFQVGEDAGTAGYASSAVEAPFTPWTRTARSTERSGRASFAPFAGPATTAVGTIRSR